MWKLPAGTMRRGPAFALVIILFVAATARAGTGVSPESGDSARTVSAGEFAREIGQLEASARLLQTNPGSIQALSHAIPEGWIVGEEHIAVSAESLRALTEKIEAYPRLKPELLAALDAQLAEMEELAASLSRPSEGGDAHAKLGQILARPEFDSAMKESDYLLWKTRLLRWLVQKLGALFRALPMSGAIGQAYLWGVLALLVALLAVWLFRQFRGHQLALMELEPPLPRGITWGQWMRAGKEFAQAGQCREACHAFYWAAVYRLADLNVWSLDRARTPREYLRLMGERAGAARSSAGTAQISAEQRRALEALTNSFELTWYGYRSAGDPEIHSALTQLEVLGCRLP